VRHRILALVELLLFYHFMNDKVTVRECVKEFNFAFCLCII